jgi:hypothetical protein
VGAKGPGRQPALDSAGRASKAGGMAWLVANWLRIPYEFRIMEEFFCYGIDEDALVERYTTAIDLLAEGNIDDWMAQAQSLGVQEHSLQHFNDHWLGGVQWPSIGGEVVAERLQLGFMAAMNTAREHRKPYNIVWVALDDTASDFFEVDHVVGANGVTVVIATAPPAEPEA